MEIPRRFKRLQAELERPLHWDSYKSPSSTRIDPVHPTCSYSKMQDNHLQSLRPTALRICIYCMERPQRQEHQAPQRHPKQRSTICTLQIRLEHQCYGPQARPQLAYTSTTPQNPLPHHVVQPYKIHFGIVNINFLSVILPRPQNSQDRLYHELSYIQVQHRISLIRLVTIFHGDTFWGWNFSSQVLNQDTILVRYFVSVFFFCFF